MTIEWNARPKHWGTPKFRGRKHPASPSALFSPIFSRAREKIGPSETTGNRKSVATSQSRLRRASIPTPFVPSGHFPLIGGIGPWKGSQGARTAGGAAEKGDNLSVSLRLTAPLKGVPWVCASRKPFLLDFPAHFR